MGWSCDCLSMAKSEAVAWSSRDHMMRMVGWCRISSTSLLIKLRGKIWLPSSCNHHGQVNGDTTRRGACASHRDVLQLERLVRLELDQQQRRLVVPARLLDLMEQTARVQTWSRYTRAFSECQKLSREPCRKSGSDLRSTHSAGLRT